MADKKDVVEQEPKAAETTDAAGEGRELSDEDLGKVSGGMGLQSGGIVKRPWPFN